MQKSYAIFSAMFVSTLVLSSCAVEKEDAARGFDRETSTVSSGTVLLSDARIGYVSGDEQAALGAKTGGRVVGTYVKKGDRVKAGQTLAQLDSSEASESVRTAGDALANTEAVYGNTSSLFDAQILAMQDKANQASKGIELAEAALRGANVGLTDTKSVSDEQLNSASKQVDLANVGLETVKTQLDSTSELFDQKMRDAYSNGREAISATSILAENLFAFTDETFWITDRNRNKNDAFETYLWAKDSSAKTRVENLFWTTNARYAKWKTDVAAYPSNVSSDSDAEKAYALLKQSEALLEDLRTLSKADYDAFDATVPSSALDDAAIANLKSQATNFRSSVDGTLVTVSGNYVVGVKGARQTIDTLKNEKNLQLSLLKKQVDLAQKQLDAANQSHIQYRAMANGQVNEVSTKQEIAQKQLEISKEQYQEALSGLAALKKQKSAQLSTISVQLSGIRGNKNLAGIQMGNGTLVAPFDGVVVDKLASIGQVVGPGAPLFVVAKDDFVKIKAYLPEAEMANVRAGDIAQIMLSGSASGTSAPVSLIDPSADPVTKKMGMEMRVPNPDGKIVLWTTVDVRIAGKGIQGKVVPYRFIEYSFGYPSISVKQADGVVRKVRITLLGCSSDDCVVEGDMDVNDTLIAP